MKLPCDAPKQTLVERAAQSVRPAPCGFYSFKRSAFGIRRYWGITNAMMLFRLVQIFRPIKEINRKHSGGYAEDLSTQRGRKRCAKMDN